MLLGLILLKEAKMLSALQQQESVPTLSRTLNLYEWPLDELIATCRSMISAALEEASHKARTSAIHLPDPCYHRGAGERCGKNGDGA